MQGNFGSKKTGRIRTSAGITLITMSSAILLASAGAKFAGVSPVVGQLAAFGLVGNKLLFVATLEVMSAAFFLIPATRAMGLLLVSSFLGGAIATHLQHSQSIAAPSIILSLLWLGAWLRHPEVFWTSSHGKTEAQRV